MTNAPEVEEIHELVDLLQVIDLVAMTTHEISGKRVENRLIPEGQPETSFAVQNRRGDDWMEVRFRMTVRDSEAEYLAEIGAEYGASKPIHFEESVSREFIERVAVMAVFPFLREAIAATAARLGFAPPLFGLLRAGAFEVGPPASDL